MRLLTLTLLPLIAYLTLYARSITGSTLVSDIQNIHASVTALTDALHIFTPNGTLPDAFSTSTLTTGIPVLRHLLAVHVYNRKGYLDAHLTRDLTPAEAKEIVKTVAETVAVSIPASVELLEKRKGLVREWGLTGLVVNVLRRLMGFHDSFSEVVMRKADGVLKGEERGRGEWGVRVIHEALEERIRGLEGSS